MSTVMKTTRDVKGVGLSIPRPDGPEKVTGKVQYVADIQLRGLLHAKLLRSPHAHARIKRIDTSRAKALAGVRAVLTAADMPYLKKKAPTRAHAVLAIDRVVFAGQPVAAVAADEAAIAEEALDLIEVEYEVLPAAVDPLEAMKPGAPPVAEAGTEADTSEAQAHGSVSGRRRRMTPVLEAVGRARLLAVVAAVQAVAERDPVLDREDPVGLHQPGQASTGVDRPGGHDRTGRAGRGRVAQDLLFDGLRIEDVRFQELALPPFEGGGREEDARACADAAVPVDSDAEHQAIPSRRAATDICARVFTPSASYTRPSSSAISASDAPSFAAISLFVRPAITSRSTTTSRSSSPAGTVAPDCSVRTASPKPIRSASSRMIGVRSHFARTESSAVSQMLI